MKEPPECPKCQAAMEPGFILGTTGAGRQPSTWIDGEPEESLWMGTKIAGKKRLEIQTFRCVACGYLESYAV